MYFYLNSITVTGKVAEKSINYLSGLQVFKIPSIIG